MRSFKLPNCLLHLNGLVVHLRSVQYGVLPLLFILAAATKVWALPIDNFNVPSETRCKGERTCKRNLSSQHSLGGFLGIEVQNPAEGKGITLLETKTGPNKGRVVWGAAGDPAGRLTLFWDGDPNPSQVSGAGLGCLNLSADGATAFILEGLAYSAACSMDKSSTSSGGAAVECPPLLIESKIYDATDPTGQRYSTSIIRRHQRLSGSDLRIPFSSFTREGPNGGARPSCVGAISVAIRADDLKKSVVTFGPIYTNGACQTGSCLLPPPFMPLPTSEGQAAGVAASPLPQPTIATPATAAPSKTPTIIPSIARPSVIAKTAKTPQPGSSSSEPAITQTPAQTSRSVTKDAPNALTKAIVAPVTEEFIFGDVIDRKLPTTPVPTALAEPTRRPVPTTDPLELIP